VLSVLAHAALFAALSAGWGPEAAEGPVGWATVRLAGLEIPEAFGEAPKPSAPGEPVLPAPSDVPPEPVELLEETAATLPLEPLEDPPREDTALEPALDLPLEAAAKRTRPPARPAAASPAPVQAPRAPSAPGGAPPSALPAAGRLVPVHRPPLGYPPEALRRGLGGRATVEVTVDARGLVTSARLVDSSGHAILDQAALHSAGAWRFAPPGHERRARIPFRFDPRAR
jgi:protein TonB